MSESPNSTSSNGSNNNNNNNKDETEMERIARLGREFREQETARIAQEKETAQVLAQQKKQDELQKIALAKGLTLEEAAKEMEKHEKERLSILAMSKEENQKMMIDSNVSEKAKLLSEKDLEQKKRLEESSSPSSKVGFNSFGNRKKSSSSSSSPCVSTESDNKTTSGSPSGDTNNLEGIDVSSEAKRLDGRTKQRISPSTGSNKNRDSNTKDEPSASSEPSPNNNNVSTQEDENEDDTFFDAPMTTRELQFDETMVASEKPMSSSDKEQPALSTKKAVVAQQTTTAAIRDDENYVQSERKAAEQFSNDDDDDGNLGTRTIDRLQSQESAEYFDSLSSQPSTSDNIEISASSTTKSSTTDTTSVAQLNIAGNNLAIDSESSRQNVLLQDVNNDQYMQSLVMRRRDDQTFGSSQRRKKRKGSIGGGGGGGESDGGGNNMHDAGGRKEATVEFPIEYKKLDGTFEVLRETNINMSVYVPPSRVQGRWSGMLEGRSTLGGIGKGRSKTNNNNATGSITLDYKASSWSRLTMGLIRGHELFHPMITLGGSIMKDGSTVGIIFYHNASFLHAMLLEHSMFALSFRHHFQKSKWIVSSHLSRKQQLSVALTNPKISVSAGCNLRRPGEQLNLRFDTRPKISDDRRGHLYCQWQLGRGIWQIGASLVQSLHSQVATVGLGVRVLSTRGMEWIISWNRGNATMKIPILITRGLQNVSVAEILYFSFLSFLIEEGIADLWGWKEEEVSKSNPTIEGGLSSSSSSLKKKKSQTNAELQRNLMERQAKRKKRIETEKNGLVIVEAIYQLKDGEDVVSWDVTIPLQFWTTSSSSLNLAATSKSQLLGFYDLTEAKSATKVKTNATEEAAPSSSSSRSSMNPWWKDTINDLFDLKLPSSKSHATTKQSSSSDTTCDDGGQPAVPTLTVKYEFKGESYSMTVSDTDELQLPNPKAKRVSSNTKEE